MKTFKTGRLLRAGLSPPGLYTLYFLSILVLPRPYLVSAWSLLIYFGILFQGFRLIALVVYSFVQSVFLRHPVSPASFSTIAACLFSQLVCWPIFFLHSTYIMLIPYAISIGALDVPMPRPVAFSSIAPFYLLCTLILPSLVVILGFLLFLICSHRPRREKCVAFTTFVFTFTVVLLLNASGIAPIPNELVSILWLLPSILMFAYLADSDKPELHQTSKD